jgi:tetraacyldisaccharide-1-P 4'-kinase
LRRKQESEADFFLTTEKDQVNLEALIDRLGSLQIARLKTTLEDPRTAMQWLIHTLEQRCGCRL